MRLSVIIPAYNEEKLLPGCLASVAEAVSELRAKGTVEPDWTPEVIVADNASTDATAGIAAERGARVVREEHRQISRARNAGAAAAGGEWLLFIDADSSLHPATLRELLEAIRSGRVAAGGCLVAFDRAPPMGRLGVRIWNLISRTQRWAAGSFVFCRADAFRETGGFSSELYAAEEIDFSRRLKRWARTRRLRFVILTAQPHVSSGRKFELYSRRELLRSALRTLLAPLRTGRDRERLPLFYDGRR